MPFTSLNSQDLSIGKNISFTMSAYLNVKVFNCSLIRIRIAWFTTAQVPVQVCVLKFVSAYICIMRNFMGWCLMGSILLQPSESSEGSKSAIFKFYNKYDDSYFVTFV